MPRIRKKTSSSIIVISGETPEFNPPSLKLSLRLLHGGEIALGPGKADLLEAIARMGSISAAGKSMDMSYRRAWELVDVMNRCFKGPLVETAKGGSHGGGAHLTPLGESVLAQYRAMDKAAKQVAQAYMGLFANMMAGPASPELPAPLELKEGWEQEGGVAMLKDPDRAPS
jgi:molybdate transport system regulatory protein